MGPEIIIPEAHSIQKYMEQYLWTRGVRKWVRKYLFRRHNPYGNTQYLWSRNVQKSVRKYLFRRHNPYGNTWNSVYGRGVSGNGSGIFIPEAQSIWKYTVSME